MTIKIKYFLNWKATLLSLAFFLKLEVLGTIARNILENSRKFQKILENSKKFLKILKNSRKLQ